MKLRNIALASLFFLAALPSLISCGVDRWPEYAAWTVRDRWIDSIMRINYLWYDEMASSKSLNYFTDPATFIKAAVPSKDRGFTYADTILLSADLSYGFEYALYRSAENDTAYNALITYILPESPASDAGLQRGNWIMQVNGNLISKKTEAALLNGTSALELMIGHYTERINENETVTGIIVEDRTVQMAAARTVEDNPVNYYNTYDRGGYKVGYVVYNHFTSGSKTDPDKYNNELRAISNTLKSAGVKIMIVDLRYNKGGETECAQLLGTILAPVSKLGSTMAYLEYSDKRESENKELLFDTQLLGSGSNLDPSTIIVLSTSVTAGASEMVMNCLNAPVSSVALIGQNTVGQNVATRKYVNPSLLWNLNLVEYMIYNSDKKSDYTGGFIPTYALDETQDLLHFLPFGDENETLLSAALGMIDGTYPPAAE